MRGLSLHLLTLVVLPLSACAPSLPPEFEAGTTCEVRALGTVHLAYGADCSCVEQLHALARQALAVGGVVPAEAELRATTWVYAAPPVRDGQEYAGWYVRAADGGPAVVLDGPMDALAHELVHAWRVEHEGVAVEDEVAHRWWSTPRGPWPSLWHVALTYQRQVASGQLCQLER